VKGTLKESSYAEDSKRNVMEGSGEGALIL
jgi:hypothetical protein